MTVSQSLGTHSGTHSSASSLSLASPWNISWNTSSWLPSSFSWYVRIRSVKDSTWVLKVKPWLVFILINSKHEPSLQFSLPITSTSSVSKWSRSCEREDFSVEDDSLDWSVSGSSFGYYSVSSVSSLSDRTIVSFALLLHVPPTIVTSFSFWRFIS